MAGTCVADAGQASDAGYSESDGGSPPGPAMCDGLTVDACSETPDGAVPCEETFCGGRLWRDGAQGVQALIPYRIVDPYGEFSSACLAAIQAGAAAWVRATGGFVRFEACAPCTGRFVSVVPGPGDGLVGGPFEQILPMPAANSTAQPSLHQIAHQWGHAIGLDDMYRRRDRDAYARFSPDWCENRRPGIPARCAQWTTAEPGSPPPVTGTFGPYDEQSKMNGLLSDGICSGSTPEPDSADPTPGDASAVFELYSGYIDGWAPFQPVGESLQLDGLPNYQPAPGVDPVGAPTIASQAPPAVEIFVRGADGSLYGIQNLLSGTRFVAWSGWTVVATNFDSDPSACFGAPGTLYLAARSSSDEKIWLGARVAGTWGTWISLGAPDVGAASAPVVAAGGDLLYVLVRGTDGLVYNLACHPDVATGTNVNCPGPWEALPPSPSGPFIGKPSVSWDPNGEGMYVTAVTGHQGAQVIGGSPSAWGSWDDLAFEVVAVDAQPAVAAAGPGDSHYFAPDSRGLLLDGTRFASTSTIGGLLASAPSAIGSSDGSRIDVVALINDHGHPGVWWRFWGSFSPPCNYNAPGTCAQCGCGTTGAPPCDY